MISDAKVEAVILSIMDAVLTELKELVEQIVLYGSYARGDYTLESDMNFLVLLDCDKSEIRKYRVETSHIASRIGLKYDIVVSLLPRDKESFNQGLDYIPFFQNVKKEGIVIYSKLQNSSQRFYFPTDKVNMSKMRIYTVEEIKTLLTPIFEKYNVNSAVLFGSYARKKATEKSDIDLLVDSGLKGLEFIGLVEAINTVLGKESEVMDISHIELESRIAQEIRDAGILIYMRNEFEIKMESLITKGTEVLDTILDHIEQNRLTDDYSFFKLLYSHILKAKQDVSVANTVTDLHYIEGKFDLAKSIIERLECNAANRN